MTKKNNILANCILCKISEFFHIVESLVQNVIGSLLMKTKAELNEYKIKVLIGVNFQIIVREIVSEKMVTI